MRTAFYAQGDDNHDGQHAGEGLGFGVPAPLKQIGGFMGGKKEKYENAATSLV